MVQLAAFGGFRVAVEVIAIGVVVEVTVFCPVVQVIAFGGFRAAVEAVAFGVVVEVMVLCLWSSWPRSAGSASRSR